MARSRNIKPGYFKNDALCECEPLARILFAGLWCWADRDGRLEERPKLLKAEMLPYDDCNIESLLQQLAAGGFIRRYAVGGVALIDIPNFSVHQNPHKDEKSKELPSYSEEAAYKPAVTTGLALCDFGSDRADSLLPITDSLNLQPVHSNLGLASPEPGENRTEPIPAPKKNPPASKPIVAGDLTFPLSLDTPQAREAADKWLSYKRRRGQAYKEAIYFNGKLAEFTDPAVFIAAVESSIGNSYTGLFLADRDKEKKNALGRTADRVGPGQRYAGPADENAPRRDRPPRQAAPGAA